MSEKKFINGNVAVANAVKLSKTEVVAAYPITPQSTIVEKISEYIADGEMDAEFIKVESEHSALSAVYGASVTGNRVFTATSSQGLAYMFEVLPYISGSRLPVVMAVVNRGVAAPWSVWNDHQDSIACRDTGWIQLYVETAQEALDTCLQAYRIAEETSVLTPVMVCLDGFVLSHTDELVEVPAQQEADAFLPAYQPAVELNLEEPRAFVVGAGPEIYTEFKFQQQSAINKAKDVILEVDQSFAKIFGRSYHGLVDSYCCEDAEAVLVTMGSVTGTARDSVDRLRAEGKKVGLLKLRSFRPFPEEVLRALLGDAKAVGVMDRSYSFGYAGAVGTEVKAALQSLEQKVPVYNFIAGLGGRDIKGEDIEGIYDKLLQARNNPEGIEPVQFVGLRW